MADASMCDNGLLLPSNVMFQGKRSLLCQSTAAPPPAAPSARCFLNEEYHQSLFARAPLPPPSKSSKDLAAASAPLLVVSAVDRETTMVRHPNYSRLSVFSPSSEYFDREIRFRRFQRCALFSFARSVCLMTPDFIATIKQQYASSCCTSTYCIVTL